MSKVPRWWFWAALLVPAALTAAGLALQGGSIQKSVESSVRAALAGQPGAKVFVTGRDATISGLPAELVPAARNAAEAAGGVQSVSTVEPYFAPMRIIFRGGEVLVTGSTEQAAWREHFVRTLGEHTHGKVLVDQTRTAPNTDFPVTTASAAAAISVLSRQPSDLTLAFDGGKVTVAGVVPEERRRAAVRALMQRLFGADRVIDQTRTKE